MTATPVTRPMIDFPAIRVLGIKVSTLNREELLSAIQQLARSHRRALVLSGNVHSFNLAYENPWLKDFLNRADIVRLDGAGLRLGAWILGHRTPPRNTWADFGPVLAKACVEAGLKPFFLGSCDGRALRAAERLKLKNPGLCVTGVAHGFFDLQPESDDNREVVSVINHAKPDILIVGIGMPRQEQWILDNLDRLDVPVIMTGGAVFDFLSGSVPRAPLWMRHAGLEWMFRLLREPRRLWKRYLLGNPKFMYRILRERLSTVPNLRLKRSMAPETTSARDSCLAESHRPIVHIMGIPVTCFTVDSLHDHLVKLIHQRQKAIVANVNLHAMNLAHENSWFHDFLCKAECVFCDGAGVLLAARLLGQRDLRVRITYADWLPLLAELCQNQSFSLYLLGARPGVAQEAARQLTLRCPTLRIAGVQHGYFDQSSTSSDNERVIRDINASGADILIVSLGMPLQERWLAENWDTLRVNVALTAGGALDYVSGTLRRPPRWMTANGLEWLGRVIVEPRRLWRRYFIGNPLFVFRISRTVVKEAWGRWRTRLGDDPSDRQRGNRKLRLDTGTNVMPWPALVAIGVLLVVLYGLGGNAEEVETRGQSAIGWMISRWRDAGDDFSHAWAIPFISLYLVWRQRQELRAAVRRESRVGLIVILGSLVLYGLGIRGQQTRLCLLSLIGLLWGMPLYFCGWDVARRLLFPCAYLLFCIPLTFLDNITVPLRLVISTVSTAILNGLGIPAVQHGTAIRSLVGEGFNLEVADACSGLRSLLAMMALMAPYAYLTQKTVLRKWVLFLLCPPIVALGNSLRIISVAVAAIIMGQARATGFYHDYSGYLFFVAVVLMAVGAGRLVQQDFCAMVRRWKNALLNPTS